MTEALDAAAGLESRLAELVTTSDLPEKPDYKAADEWLISAYQRTWEANRRTRACPGCGGVLNQGAKPWHWFHSDGNLNCPR